MSSKASLRIVSLGGLGRIGGNLLVLETQADLIAIDCGVLFPTPEQPGVDYVIPDISYILSRREKFRGIVLTHGHEDHIGAVPYILGQIEVPVYGTGLTLALLSGRLTEFENIRPNLKIIRDNQEFSLGQFTILPIPVTHSIPDGVALAIQTPIGRLVHSGDFKFDESPIDGRRTDLEVFRKLGDQGVTVMLSDSTNSERSGRTWSEAKVSETLSTIFADAQSRILVTMFASNLHRIQKIIEISAEHGRRVVPVGRSVKQNIQIALETGYIHAPKGVLAEIDEINRIAPARLTVIASGSQGEPQSAVARIAAGNHAQVSLDRGDLAILSSRRIPGNERAINIIANNLSRLGAEVIDDRIAQVHTSGHAFNDEQRELIELCRPEFFVPIHGEYRHLSKHARLAEDCGLKKQNIFIIEDGTAIDFLAHKKRVQASLDTEVPHGHVYVDGNGIGDVTTETLRDRRRLADTGIVVCVVSLRHNGNIAHGPEIFTQGVFAVGTNTGLINQAQKEIRTLIAKKNMTEDECRQAIHAGLRRFFRHELARRPFILPVVLIK